MFHVKIKIQHKGLTSRIWSNFKSEITPEEIKSAIETLKKEIGIDNDEITVMVGC